MVQLEKSERTRYDCGFDAQTMSFLQDRVLQHYHAGFFVFLARMVSL